MVQSATKRHTALTRTQRGAAAMAGTAYSARSRQQDPYQEPTPLWSSRTPAGGGFTPWHICG